MKPGEESSQITQFEVLYHYVKIRWNKSTPENPNYSKNCRVFHHISDTVKTAPFLTTKKTRPQQSGATFDVVDGRRTSLRRLQRRQQMVLTSSCTLVVVVVVVDDVDVVDDVVVVVDDIVDDDGDDDDDDDDDDAFKKPPKNLHVEAETCLICLNETKAKWYTCLHIF